MVKEGEVQGAFDAALHFVFIGVAVRPHEGDGRFVGKVEEGVVAVGDLGVGFLAVGGIGFRAGEVFKGWAETREARGCSGVVDDLLDYEVPVTAFAPVFVHVRD